MRLTFFDRLHPAVAFGYFAGALVLCMAAFQPVFIALSLAGALAWGCALDGPRRTALSLRWQLPLVAIVALLNPLFSASGSTELIRIGASAVYLESLVYGACMGMMLVAAMRWFANAGAVLTSDKVMTLFGNVAPVVALVLSMAMRLVPRFVRRGGEIDAVRAAAERTAPRGARERLGARARLMSVLMGWSMEDSLETADAMRARGWGIAARRTTYARARFRARDALALAIACALALLSGALAAIACAQFTFYPRLSALVAWWGYVPYAVFLLAPLAGALVEEARWK